MAFLENEFFLLALTFVVFLLAKILQEKTGWLLLNPILVCIVLLIVFLKLTGISYQTYQEAGQVIDFWLKPAVVALGVPLYLQLESIRKQIIPILMSQMAGCAVGVISVSLIAKWAGASQEVIVSLAAKSVTTPIAILRRALRGSRRFQSADLDSCGQPDGARPFDGNGFPRGRHGHRHEPKPKIRCLRQPRPDDERHPDRLADPADTGMDRGHLNCTERAPPIVTNPNTLKCSKQLISIFNRNGTAG